MAARDWPPCPCRARRAEQVAAARRRILWALTAAGLAVLAIVCVSGDPVSARHAAAVRAGWPPAGLFARLGLIAVAVAAVGAFTGLQFVARSRRRGPPAFADWRTWPPGYDPWADGGGGDVGRAASGHAASGHGGPAAAGAGRWPDDPSCLRYS
jgi:hypothetical protein